MDYKVKNKTALIGGASKGLGKACAIQLAEEGVNLVICARNTHDLNKTAEEIINKTGVEVLAVPTDLSDISQIKPLIDAAYSKFGNIDILITNSGGPKPGSFFNLELSDWDTAYHSVLLYIVELYRAIIPKMKENNWGRIINIVSLTVKEPNEGLLLSNVFRSGVVSLAKSISNDLIKSNITINNICPAAFKTDRAIQLMTNQANIKGISIEEVEANIVKELPMKRFNKPEELSSLAAFLCSEQAEGITGTTIQVDGGMQKFIF